MKTRIRTNIQVKAAPLRKSQADKQAGLWYSTHPQGISLEQNQLFTCIYAALKLPDNPPTAGDLDAAYLLAWKVFHSLHFVRFLFRTSSYHQKLNLFLSEWNIRGNCSTFDFSEIVNGIPIGWSWMQRGLLANHKDYGNNWIKMIRVNLTTWDTRRGERVLHCELQCGMHLIGFFSWKWKSILFQRYFELPIYGMFINIIDYFFRM